MPKYSFLIIVLALVVLAAIGMNFWPGSRATPTSPTTTAVDSKEDEKQDMQVAKDLLNSNQPEDALKIILKHKKDIELFTESGKTWSELYIQANEQLKDGAQLVQLYDFSPKSFEGHEKASLLVAENFLISGKARDFQKLREEWKGKETRKEAWFILDADYLLLQGKRKEAIDFLSTQTFDGKADTGRLIRLALLNVSEQPKLAWDYLNEAYKKDPTNPEIRSYRAKLLEAVGKNSLALTEYVGAIQADPKNLYLKDQLAEFLLRNKQYPQALQLWSENLKPPSLDFIWIKTLFWSKVISPIKFDWSSVPVPPGKQEPYIQYLLGLKPNQYWDKAAFEKIPDSSRFLKTEQSTFWLRLIQALKNNDEAEAQQLLQFNIFNTISANPQLETGIKRILSYHKTGTLTLPEDNNQVNTAPAPPPKALKEGAESSFFEKLTAFGKDKNAQIPPDLQNLLKSDLAIPAAFLAADWFEVALQLNKDKIIPSNMPEWVSYGFALAIKTNRGNMEALEFVTKQNQTPAISMLTAELLIATGAPDSAVDLLTKLAKQNDAVGARATWLLSMLQIEKGQLKEAKELISQSPLLSKEVLGKETLAKIALMENNSALADQIYTSIEKQSPEAKSFLARKAFKEKNWKKAHDLTQELINEYPTNALLRDNLKKIEEEQQKEEH